VSFANRLILRIKRSNSPFFRLAKKAAQIFFQPTIPPLPKLLLAPLRIAYELHFLTIVFFRSLLTICYRNPLFQARCASFGRGVSMEGLPFVSGHLEIHVGDGVKFGGKISILSGGVFDQPKLILKDRSAVGWGTKITVNKEVVIEEDVLISYDCRISDSDGHRREADLRAAGVPPDPKDIRPVRICRYAFVGNGAHIMKGVTIGEGATVGANSVVISDVPPYSLAIGNPAEILFRNYGLPTTALRKKPTKSTEPVSSVQAADTQDSSGDPKPTFR
jgi:acetyltransferase-like isoleucine patch superfamily enzyme